MENIHPLILIIEDTYTLRISWKNSLMDIGYRVEDVSDGTIGYSLMKKRIPDLIILDMAMQPSGFKEGLFFLEKKNKHRSVKEIPVILISGYYTYEDLLHLKTTYSFVKEIFVKAITTQTLKKAIEKYI
jgi:DNA-binding NtrC family response regulator